MSGFRIKSSHEFLKNEPPKEEKEPLFIVDTETKTTILENVLVPQKRKEQTNPTSGSPAGLAIRSNVSAQQDYM